MKPKRTQLILLNCFLLFCTFYGSLFSQTYTREIYTQLSNSTRYQYQILIHSAHPATPTGDSITGNPEDSDRSRFYVWESDSIEVRLVKNHDEDEFDLTIKGKGAYLWECAMCAPELISRFDFSANFCGFSIANVLPPEKSTRKVIVSTERLEISKNGKIIKARDSLIGGGWGLFFNAYPDP